jgi:hypothetical protein
MTTDSFSSPLDGASALPVLQPREPGIGRAALAADRLPGDPADPADPSGPGTGYPAAEFTLIGLSDGKILPEPRLGLPVQFSISVLTNDNEVGELSVGTDNLSDQFVVSRPPPEDADKMWSVEGFFQSDGQRTITLAVPWTHITQTNPPKSTAKIWTRTLSITVAPTDREPLALVNINGIRANATVPSIRLPIGLPSRFGVDVYPGTNTAAATRTISVFVRVDGIDSAPVRLSKTIRSNGVVLWGSEEAIVLDQTMAPRPFAGKPAPLVLIQDTDFFGATLTTEFKIETVDFTPPVLTDLEPLEDEVIRVPDVSAANPLKIKLKGAVSDIQSGYKENSLVYSFGANVDAPIPVVDGQFSVDLTVTSFGPYQLSITAADNAPVPNWMTPRVIQFSVAPGYKPGTIDELLSARSYLDELLRFTTTHVLTRPSVANQPPSFVNSETLSKTFKQAFGALALLRAKDGETPISNLLIPLRALRSHNEAELGLFSELITLGLDPSRVVSKVSAATYHEAAHQALLRAMGTSLEELRSLRTLTVNERRDLAARLNLLNGQADFLEELVPSAGGPTHGDREFEQWLANQFGLPPTLPDLALPVGVPRVLDLQQKLLTGKWAQIDRAQRWPDMDPDLVEMADLSPSPVAAEWRNLLAQREAEMARTFNQLRQVQFAREMAEQVMLAEEVDRFLELAIQDGKGVDISPQLLYMEYPISMASLRRLVSYLTMGSGAPVALTQAERDDLAHLIVHIWKPGFKYPVWVGEEARITASRPWPSAAAAAAWVPGNYRRAFLPRRGDVGSRVALERRLAERAAQWQQLLDEQQRMVITAQQQALPLLRGALVGDPMGSDSVRKLLDALSKRFLIDFAVSGSSLSTPLAHATDCIQTLIEGVSRQRFPAGHPARDWLILPAYQPGFKTEWEWIGTFAQWRAAVMNYLYPENVLYPELIDPNNVLHQAFFDFLRELSILMPLNERSLKKPPDTYTDALAKVIDSNQRDHLVPLAIGLAYQRSGQHLLALAEYRKLYDWVQPAGKRERVTWLIVERSNLPPAPNFTQIDQWTLQLSNPFEIARPGYVIRWGNPHTKFVVFQILECLLTMADQHFAAGTPDSRASALALYLEADDILGFPEMQDKEAKGEYQVDLPSPVLAARRAHVSSALRKLRMGLSYLGMPLPSELTIASNVGNVAGLVRPTPYRFKTLMERAKQLTALAQQFESQYLSAIERNEVELEKILSTRSTIDVADKTVELRNRGQTEANSAKGLAQTQASRSSIQQKRYEDWIAAGPSASENRQIDAIKSTLEFKNAVTVLEATSASLQALTSNASLFKTIDSLGMNIALGTILAGLPLTKGILQGELNGQETNIQLSGIQASQERRAQDWQLQADLATQDVAISAVQVTLAQDRIDIADQELVIANAQQLHARQMLSFLTTEKFTNAAFYEWLAGVLADIYAFFLRIAAATGTQAELQLAFERQEQPAGFLKSDYWRLASASSAGNDSTGKDRRGITGSARLAQDLYSLDQRAFDTDRRSFNLTQSFSLSRLMPIEFEQFRKTGSLSFATPMSWFDEGFPGHYMRLIKRVRLTVAALIPPSQGIRASLVNNGLTRVVTSDPGFPTVVIRQDPEMVALTSPTSSTGVFELDMQSEMLLPFEGSGVDGSWFLDLPRAANPIDFDSLVDVNLTIEYTARYSPELRERVVKAMPTTASGVRTFSVRRDLPDTWYELANGSGPKASIAVALARAAFPLGVTDVRVTEVSVATVMADGAAGEFRPDLLIALANGNARKGAALDSLGGSSAHAARRARHGMSTIAATPS